MMLPVTAHLRHHLGVLPFDAEVPLYDTAAWNVATIICESDASPA